MLLRSFPTVSTSLAQTWRSYGLTETVLLDEDSDNLRRFILLSLDVAYGDSSSWSGSCLTSTVSGKRNGLRGLVELVPLYRKL
jgi:hypothetical protein